MLKEGNLIILAYMDEVLRSVVLLFCVKTSDKDDNARTRLTIFSKNNVVRIDWLVCSSDMSKILTCLWQLWTEGPTHNNGIKKPQAFRCTVAWDIDADPSAPKHQYSEFAKLVIVLICHWWGTHSLLMKAFSSSKCDVSGYQINFMWHLKELHFKFWKLTCFSYVYEGILCNHFCEKWLWPLGYLTLCHNKGIGASKLN